MKRIWSFLVALFTPMQQPPLINPNFHYLRAASRVCDELKEFEVVFAKNQPEYLPLTTLQSRYQDGKVLSKWPLNEVQRKAIANGADIYLELLTFHRPLQPIVMFVTDRLNTEYIRAEFGFPDKDIDINTIAGTAPREA